MFNVALNRILPKMYTRNSFESNLNAINNLFYCGKIFVEPILVPQLLRLAVCM